MLFKTPYFILFLLSCLFITQFSCTVKRKNIYRFDRVVKEEFIPRSYQTTVETAATSRVDKIITILAQPELIEVSYDSFAVINTRYEMDKFLFAINSVLFTGALVGAATSDDEGMRKVYLGFSLFSVGPVLFHDLRVNGKSYETRKNIGHFKETRPLYSAVGRTVHLVFTASGRRRRILLGRIGSDNSLKVRAEELVNHPLYPFRNQEEVLYYFSVGYIDIDWLKIREKPKLEK